MLKEVEVVEEGFEKVVEVLKENIEEIEVAKEKEIEEATKEINAKYDVRLNRYKDELSRYVHTETIDLPDEVQETNEITEGDEIVDTVDINEVSAKEYIGE